MLNTNPFGFNTPQELNSLPSTELNWQNKLSGQIAGLFSDSLDQTKKFSSYLGNNFEKNNLTGLGDSLGKILQGDFKGGLNTAVKGLGIDKGITAGMSGVSKGITGAGNIAGLANTALDMFGVGQIDRRTQSTGSKALGTFNKYSGVLMGTPLAPLATIGAVAGAYDKVFAKSADKQGTADMSNIGYNTIINPLAGAKVGGWDRLRGKRGRINQATEKVDRANSEAYAIDKSHKQNTLASQNTTGVLQDKNYQQMMGGYGTNILAARLGTKIPPVHLRKIVNKASYKYQKGNAINRPDIKPINKLDIKPIKSTAGSTDFSNIISKALKSRDEKLKAPETFEEYRLRISKLNQNFLVDDPSYDLKGAYEAKLEPTLHEDGTYHLGSRDPNTGKIFKLPTHHSFEQTLAGEEEAGHVMYLKDGELYSAPKEQVSSSDREAAEQFIRKAMSKSYKDGGLLNKTDKEEVIEEVVEEKKNVIPEGAFHSRKNNIHEDVAKHVTHKGIPVITKDEEGKITQHAEVERNEIIFHKEATDTIETLHEKFKKADTQKLKDEIMIECGKYVADQILVNTDDRTGIIEAVEYA